MDIPPYPVSHPLVTLSLSLSTLPWQTRNPQTLITEQPISGCGSLTGYSEYTGLIRVLSLIQIDVC